VAKNGVKEPLSHGFAPLREPIWGLCELIRQFLSEVRE
jgi:hypothetical protein